MIDKILLRYCLHNHKTCLKISNIPKDSFLIRFLFFLILPPKITSLDPLPLITEYIVHSVVYHWTTPPPLYNVQYYSPQECTHACI